MSLHFRATLARVNWDVNSKPEKKQVFSVDAYDSNEQAVLQLLMSNNNQLMIDELSWKSGIPMSQLASVLLALEFKGVVLPQPGKMFKLKV
jgi:DNA processing protein